MEFNIDVCTQPDGMLIIRDFSRDYEQYLDEQAPLVSTDTRFKFTHTVTLNCFTKVTTKAVTLLDVLLSEHEVDKLDSTYFKIDKDGYYVVDHIIIPTVQWYNEVSAEQLALYDVVYLTDGDKLFKVVDGAFEECTIKELMERNIYATTIMRTKIDVFFTGHLQECYINYCKRIFDSYSSSRCLPSTKNMDTFSRDFVWMTLNIIDYLISFKQYLEAQTLLEMFVSCNGLCNDRKLEGFKHKPCGCS